jgi:hypothetical protein
MKKYLGALLMIAFTAAADDILVIDEDHDEPVQKKRTVKPKEEFFDFYEDGQKLTP